MASLNCFGAPCYQMLAGMLHSCNLAKCSLVEMQEIPNKDKYFEGGQYARTEKELYEKAIALLEKCTIETQPSGQELPVLDPST